MSLTSADKDFLSINLYYFLINEKKMCEKLSSKITGMFIEEDEILIEFRNHNFDFINKQIIDALNVLIQYNINKTDEYDLESLKNILIYQDFKNLAKEYLVNYSYLTNTSS